MNVITTDVKVKRYYSIATQSARIIPDAVVFLTLTDEDDLNLDTVVKMTKALASQSEDLDKGFLRERIDAFAVVATQYSDEAQEVVRTIAHGFCLEEALASDDPVRLAELDALRGARD